VKSVRHHARLDERLAVGVEVQTPRIARAFREDFKDVPGRMIAPDAGIDRCAVLVRRAGLADTRMSKNTVAAVQPTVRPPAEGIERLVSILVMPSVKKDLRLAGRLVLALLDWHVHQVRRRPDPDAAEADLQAADEVQPFHEHGSLVEMAVA